MHSRTSNQRESGVVRTVNVLSIDPIAKDRVTLKQIFGRSEWALCPNSKWKLRSSPTVESAIASVRKNQIPVLVCGCDDNPDAWKAILAELATVWHPPLLIVTSRTADERLWAEALNLGAYDVLAKPFDQAEVIRTMSMAWLHWKERPVVMHASAY
jgi:DNA-binding NtrC family response regulator